MGNVNSGMDGTGYHGYLITSLIEENIILEDVICRQLFLQPEWESVSRS